MEAAAFVRKWAASTQKESAASQSHFNDLCSVLGEDDPNTADPHGDCFAFEKGALVKGGNGFADVWLKGHFAWEYKGKHKDLGKAYEQIQRYREALENPPLLVVCDLDRFEIHTNWNTETWIYKFRMADITGDEHVDVHTISGGDAKDAPSLTAMQVLRALFANPDALKPQRTRDQVTRDAAKMFETIASDLRKWKVDDMRIARFITKVLFCMFATDVRLLPRGTFSEVVRVHRESGDAKAFREYLSRLFKIMNKGGKFAMHTIPQFNGRMFEDADVPDEVTGEHIHLLERLDALEWSDVEPAIFGTLFERVLDHTNQRASLGAHYTSRADIELIVEPVLMEPLRAELRELKVAVGNAVDELTKKKATAETRRERVKGLLAPFHKKISTIRVLDPACGSGNFLYVSLALLKALEKELIVFADIYDVSLKSKVHPRQLYGIEINPYAHELASAVIWIGYLQWKAKNEPGAKPDVPVLEPLDQIEHKDAIVEVRPGKAPVEATWPAVDVIVGNPPFLGRYRMRAQLDDEYVERLFSIWDDRVPKNSDLVCYWFEKARSAIEHGEARRAGLLATQAIRGGANRHVLNRIKETGDIFYAQSDRPWILEGATVRVSMVGFDNGSEHRRLIYQGTDGTSEQALQRATPVEGINANLTSSSDVAAAQRLRENIGVCSKAQSLLVHSRSRLS